MDTDELFKAGPYSLYKDYNLEEIMSLSHFS